MRPVVEVRETEDESLLFTVRRRLRPFPGWEVYDAGERLVGTFRSALTGLTPAALLARLRKGSRRRAHRPQRRLVKDWTSRRVAVVEQAADGSGGHFCTWEGAELGTTIPGSGGTRVIFGPALDNRPFTKMLLLAVALIDG